MAFLLKEHQLFKKNGNELRELENKDVFSEVDIMGYYFGAKWCTDCVKFTIILKEFYNAMKSNNESFEVVYISSDKTDQEMQEFVLDSHGDWFVFYMDEIDDESESYKTVWNFRDLFAITGIPSLIVTKKDDDEVCTMDGVTGLVTMGNDVINEWKQKTVELELDFDKEVTGPREEGKIIPNCCRISQFKPWVPTPPTEILSEKMLLKKKDDGFREMPPTLALEEAKIVAFYFAASWCGACHEFTYELKKCYEQLQNEENTFEVVFVSSEEDREDTKELMENFHGNWLAIHCDEATEEHLSKLFAVQLLPTVRIVNQEGEMVSKFGVRDIRLKGASAFNAWCSGTPATTAEEEKQLEVEN